MPIDKIETNNLRAAYALGESVAKSYKPGELFLGAFGEADRLGYTQDGDALARSVFITAYLQFLPRPVVTDYNGIVQSIG